MNPPDTHPSAHASRSARRLIPEATTARVAAAVLVVMGALFFFMMMPMAWRWPVRVASLASLIWLGVVTVRALRAAHWTLKKLMFVLVLGVLCYLVLSAICFGFNAVMSKRDDRLSTRGLTRLPPECRAGIQAVLDDNRLNQFSAEIGWVPRPAYDAPGYKISAQGLRGTREYSPQPADPDRRILCMGDSFTFGVAVKNDESYPAQAEKLRPGTEWLNFGILGGCLVQSYKRYLHAARRYGGRRVVIGFMTNDAQRTVNAFRPFVNVDSGCPLTKPFAKFQDGRFTVEPNPYTDLSQLRRLLDDDVTELRKLMTLDYLTWGRRGFGSIGPIGRTLLLAWEAMHVEQNLDALLPRRLPLSGFVKNFLPRDPYGADIWNPRSAGFRAICGMFDEYHRQVVADGREPLFVIIPGPIDVDDLRQKYRRKYAPLMDHLRAKNYAFLDFLDPLAERHKADLSQDAIFVRLHYQPHVNRELAEEIIKALKLP